MATARLLIDAIKNTLLRYQNAELRGITTWKRGVLPPKPAFPALAIMPESVNFDYNYSGGKYVAKWRISVEVFARHRTPEEAMDQVRYYTGVIKQIMKEHAQWGGLAVDSEVFPKQYEESIPFQGQLLQLGAVPIEITTYEQLPEDRQTLTEFRFTDSIDLAQAIFKRLNWQKNESKHSLAKVAGFYRAQIPPIPNYPAITLVEPLVNTERIYAGLDANTRSFSVDVLTQLVDQEINLDLNLDLVEQVLDILQIWYMWEGRCINSWAQSIEFDRESNAVGRVYRSSIEYFCQTPEQIHLQSRLRP